MSGAGRFAPTPSGDLHIGNLRTGLLAWLFARSTGRSFLMRIEDLDRERCDPAIAERQLADLASLGIEWDGPVETQSEHSDRCESALAILEREGLTYPCFCTRAERAAQAPHGSPGRYSGRCRELSREEHDRLLAAGRRPSLRARVGGQPVAWDDLVLGPASGLSDDPIVRRADGVFAYNLAVVVDDSAAGVDQVVRGDDLADSVPVQAALGDALGLPRPQWAHVPLVLGEDRERLAKRGGGVTLAQRLEQGQGPDRVLALLGSSLGLCASGDAVTAADLLGRFDPASLPREAWVLPQAP
jgi:glutamyl-tRNA synthetase